MSSLIDEPEAWVARETGSHDVVELSIRSGTIAVRIRTDSVEKVDK